MLMLVWVVLIYIKLIYICVLLINQLNKNKMYYCITTYQNEKQLLGSDFTKIVKNCKSKNKLINEINLHKQTLKTLLNIKPFLNNGYTIKVQKISRHVLHPQISGMIKW